MRRKSHLEKEFMTNSNYRFLKRMIKADDMRTPEDLLHFIFLNSEGITQIWNHEDGFNFENKYYCEF